MDTVEALKSTRQVSQAVRTAHRRQCAGHLNIPQRNPWEARRMSDSMSEPAKMPR